MFAIGKILVALAAICIAMGLVAADGGDAFGTDGADPAHPALVAHVVGSGFVLENVGTAPSVDCGGAKIMVGSECVGLLPYTTVLNGNPFTFGKYDHPPANWDIKVQLTRPLLPGEKVTVTNGVGIYAQCIAQ